MKAKFKLLLISLFLVFVIVFSINIFYTQVLNYSNNVIELNKDLLNDLKGFDDNDGNIVLQKLIAKINLKLSDVARTEKTLKQFNLIISFLVVVLTGLATLFTSIQSFKEQTPLTKKRLTIWVLILTFVSTIGNSGILQLNKEIDSIGSRQKKIMEMREKLFVEYNSYRDNQKELEILEIKYESYLSDL